MNRRDALGGFFVVLCDLRVSNSCAEVRIVAPNPDSGAQTIVLTTRDGKTTDVRYSSSTLKKKAVVLDSGRKLSCDEITEIVSDEADRWMTLLLSDLKEMRKG